MAGYADPLKYLLPWDWQTQSAIHQHSGWVTDSLQSPLPTYEVFHLSLQLLFHIVRGLRTKSVSKLGHCWLAIALNCCYSLYSGLWSLKIIFLSKLILFPLGRHCIFPLQNPAWLSTISAPSSGLACITVSCCCSSPPGPRWIWARWGLLLARGKASLFS